MCQSEVLGYHLLVKRKKRKAKSWVSGMFLHSVRSPDKITDKLLKPEVSVFIFKLF